MEEDDSESNQYDTEPRGEISTNWDTAPVLTSWEQLPTDILLTQELIKCIQRVGTKGNLPVGFQFSRNGNTVAFIVLPRTIIEGNLPTFSENNDHRQQAEC